EKTADGSNHLVLTGTALTPYIGTGQVQVSENGVATSTAAGGGNVVVNVRSTGQATMTVVYKYVPNNSIQPGNYTIVETQEPTGTAVSLVQTTGADGSYKFDGLRQGAYTVTELPPAGYIDGKVGAGSAGGTVGAEQVGSINLQPSTDATDYDFGHLNGGSLAGF